MSSIFEKASRLKLRFNYKGNCSVEDLWDMNPEYLDKMYRDLNSELNDHQVESLLNKKTREQEILTLKIEIIKYIVETKLAEIKLREDQKERAAKKQKILEIIEEKQNENLKGKSLDELTKLVNEMED